MAVLNCWRNPWLTAYHFMVFLSSWHVHHALEFPAATKPSEIHQCLIECVGETWLQVHMKHIGEGHYLHECVLLEAMSRVSFAGNPCRNSREFLR